MIETKRIKIENIHINEVFKTFLPPLQPEEYENLANDIAFHGVLDPLILWNGYIVDGHNRYEILKSLGVEEVEIKEVPFEKESDVMEWILAHQGARRNLTKTQMVEIGNKYRIAIEKEAKKNLLVGRTKGGKRKSDKQSLVQNLNETTLETIEPIRTSKKIAEKFNISENTYRDMELVVKEGTDEQKKRMDKGGKGNAVSTIAKEIKAQKDYEEVRICRTCGIAKPIKRFCLNEDHKFVCKDCMNKYKRQYSASQKEKNNEHMNKLAESIKDGIAPAYTRDSVISEIKFSVDGFIHSVVCILSEHKELVLNDPSIVDEIAQYLGDSMSKINLKEEWGNE